MARIAAIGIGNVLMGDDAFGPYVAHLLERWYAWPGDVEVVELGTQGLDLTPYVRGVESLLVLSSVHRGGAAGTLHRLSHAEILDRSLPERVPSLRSSPYEPGLRDLLLTLQFTGGAPADVSVLGAEPQSIELEGGLSPAVRAALPAAVAEAVAVLARLGAVPVERSPRPDGLPWWEIRGR